MKKIWFLLAPTLALAALACSSTPETATGSAAEALTSTTPPECDFKCKCDAKGGTVEDGWLCCKADANGKICTNSPDSIIVWKGPKFPSVSDYDKTPVFFQMQ